MQIKTAVLNDCRFDGSLLTESTLDGSDAPLAGGGQLRRTVDTQRLLSRLESDWGSALGFANF